MMRIVDLFSGAGGLSLGAHQAGMPVTTAFDIDPILTSSFQFNFPNTNLVRCDVSALTGQEVERLVDGPVDGIIGGPPCQGFSAIGRNDYNDPRRQLILDFFRLVSEVNPAFFVMENVLGLGYQRARPLLDLAIEMVVNRYEILGPLVLNAADFGAPIKRSRLFIIGIDPSRCDPLSVDDISRLRRNPRTVQEAIADLKNAKRLPDHGNFDQWKITKRGRPNEYLRSLRNDDRMFSGHLPTKHTLKVIERFKTVLPGETDKIGRHPRLAWHGQCPTLRAGTGSDRGSYQSVRPIHPEEPRVITVREAARLQGFPDEFRFHPTIWHSFRMIGNSVSPIIYEEILSAISTKFGVRKPALEAAE